MAFDRHKDKLKGEPTRQDKTKAPKVKPENKDEVFDATQKELDLERHKRAAGRQTNRFRDDRAAKAEAKEIVKKAREERGKGK